MGMRVLEKRFMVNSPSRRKNCHFRRIRSRVLALIRLERVRFAFLTSRFELAEGALVLWPIGIGRTFVDQQERNAESAKEKRRKHTRKEPQAHTILRNTRLLSRVAKMTETHVLEYNLGD